MLLILILRISCFCEENKLIPLLLFLTIFLFTVLCRLLSCHGLDRSLNQTRPIFIMLSKMHGTIEDTFLLRLHRHQSLGRWQRHYSDIEGGSDTCEPSLCSWNTTHGEWK